MKEAIFYSCQLIIEGGPTYSSTSKGSGGERDEGDGGMEGSGFEVRGVLREEVDEELRGELFYILNVFFFSHSLVFQCSLEVQAFYSPCFS